MTLDTKLLRANLVKLREVKNYMHILLVLFLCQGPRDSIVSQNPQESSSDSINQEWKRLTVLSSAYNSLKEQGHGDPTITAWGDTLVPGIKSIAVSVDLIEQGLSYGKLVQIEGLKGSYVVNDKMHSRWRNKIDIYMGESRQKALEWGRRKVEICFAVYQE